VAAEQVAAARPTAQAQESGPVAAKGERGEKNGSRRKGRGGRKDAPVAVENPVIEVEAEAQAEAETEAEAAVPAAEEPLEIVAEPVDTAVAEDAQSQPSGQAARRGRTPAAKKHSGRASRDNARAFWPADGDSPSPEGAASGVQMAETAASPDVTADTHADTADSPEANPQSGRAKPARKSAPRARRPRKTAAAS
jgi:hypothetical protein